MHVSARHGMMIFGQSRKEREHVNHTHDEKMAIYARINVPYYIVWDPEHYLTPKELHCFSLRDKRYHECEPWFPGIGLGVKEWRGEYEAWTETWLRWCDEHGQILLTAEERALKLAAQLRASAWSRKGNTGTMRWLVHQRDQTVWFP
jgi:hypothetical protein